MKVDTAGEVHPVLVADLADERAATTLRKVAIRRGTIVVPLLSAPVDRRTHVLEVYVEGRTEPHVFLAEPAGAPTEAGFPLRLELYGDSVPPPAEHAADSEPPTMMKAAKVTTSPSLSDRHTRDLEPVSEPSPDSAPYVGRKLAGGKYTLEALIGKGGMGAVYRARHRDLAKEVAVKVLHPSFRDDAEFAKRFQAEALTMSKIDHPNVTRILDFGQEEDGLLYLAMEYLDGTDLQTIIERDGALPLDRIVRLVAGVASALGHVHRHGIIHRDVKPSNIIVVAGLDEEDETPTEVPKVCDFGIAHTRGEGGRIAGTPEYMSPEQCRGLEIDARSDVYACGVLLFELATGRLPFSGDDAGAVARMQVFDAPPRPSKFVPDIDPLLEEIIMKALAKDPSARQPSMRHLRGELRELLTPVLVAAGEAGGKSPASPRVEPAAAARQQQEGGAGGSWIEGRDEGMNAFFTTLAHTVDHHNEYHEAEELAAALARDPAPWLRDLVAIQDPRRFEAQSKLLERPIRKFLKRGDASSLSPIVTALRSVLKEDQNAGPRAKYAGRILRMLREPSELGPLVDVALGAVEEPSAAVQHVLVEPQAAAAQALLDGRMRHATPSARARFVTLVRAIGPAALPVVGAALRSCLERGERNGPFVEDLVRALPPGPNEAVGTIVAELLRGSTHAIAVAGLVALAALWGERARPLLLGALGNQDAAIVAAALTGLRVLKAIDATVVRRLDPIVNGMVPASEELCVAAATALGEAQGEGRSEAATVAARAFSASRIAPTSVWTTARTAPAAASPNVAVALARALLQLNVPNATSMIHDRVASSPEGLRQKLASLLPPRM